MKIRENKNIQLFLIGNKSDVKYTDESFNQYNFMVKEKEIHNFCKSFADKYNYNIEYYETSAKLGTNINLIFELMTRKILDKIEKNEIVLDEEFKKIYIWYKITSNYK